ncbi:MAG TPA: alpha-glucosidase [Anaerolineaceae bacterium]|nr:alpha-glucosidase [Anaerolineaceae bacterium]
MTDLAWWKKAVFYQIYPRSFADATGDGIGDLRGILSKLDYLHDLGIDAVWLSPHYPSPQWDCGYDIANYTEVAPEYGSLADFKELLDGMHQRDMRLILDLVLNHTSDQHAWFIESSSSRNNPKRDWYVWRDGKVGAPPNNWYSTFGGSAWELDPKTGQYFYHFFFKQQPDLNWRNPEVKEAMFAAVRFWLDLGVDGFRLDAIGTLFEDPALTNQTCDFTQAELQRMSRIATTNAERSIVEQGWSSLFRYQHDLPETHQLMRELRALVDTYPDRMLVGETDLVDYYGDGTSELHMVFNFPLMETQRLTPEWIRANQEARHTSMPAQAWDANTLSNHDAGRILPRFGDGIHDEALARLSLALLLTLRGTPFLYNGDEIGMRDMELTDIHQFRDMLGIWGYNTEIETFGSAPEAALAYAARLSRDKCRTPMQWSAAPHAGFSPHGVTTWLPVNPNYRAGINVQEESKDPASLLNFYRTLLRVRKNTPALVNGTYLAVRPEEKDYFAFLRSFEGEICLVVLNWSDRGKVGDFGAYGQAAQVIYSTQIRDLRIADMRSVEIAPFEVLIAAIRTSK